MQRLSHAIALRDSARVEEAYREFCLLSESTSDAEEKAAVLANQARCSLLLGKLDEACHLIGQALESAPRTQTLLYIWFEQAVLRWHEGHREEALRILEDTKREHMEVLLQPTHHQLYEQIETTRAIILAELSQFEDAGPALEQCLSFDLSAKDKGEVLYNLGICLLKMGEPEQAKELLLGALKNGLGTVYAAFARYNLGVIYSREGAPAKALQEFEWCLDHADEARIPKRNIYGWLAKVSDDLGMKADADRYDNLAKQSPTEGGQ